MVLQRHNVRVTVLEIGSNGALPVIIVDRNLEIVKVLPLINHEARLVRSIGHAKPFLGPEHHLSTLHKIIHHVFQARHQSFLINNVEVNLVCADNLHPNVAFDKVDLPSRVLKLIVLVPVLFIFALIIDCFLEK